MFAGPVELDLIVDRVSHIPVLPREEESALAVRFRPETDLDAARQLVFSHLRFVVHIARGSSARPADGDLVQEGNVGLMKAVKRFDPGGCAPGILRGALDPCRSTSTCCATGAWVKVATTKAQRKLFFNLRKLKKNLGWLSERKPAVARDLKVSTAEVTEMEQRLSRDLSFDPTPESDEEETYSPACTCRSKPIPPLRSRTKSGRKNHRPLAHGHEDAG